MISSFEVKQKSDEESFTKLLSQLSSDIETMCAKHQDEKEALRQAQESSMESLRLESRDKLTKLETDHQDEISQLKQVHAASVSSLEEGNKEAVKVTKNLQTKIEKLQKDREEDKEKYEHKIVQLEAKLSAVVDNLMNSSCSKEDLLIKELRQEVESLRAVLEMKNEELRTGRHERESLNQSITSLNESQKKVETLSCQVEDLKGMLEVKVRSRSRL